MGRTGKTVSALLLFTFLAVTAAGLVFWWRLTESPQYALALLIQRVQKGDDSAVDEFIDMDKVIDDFFPQVQEKAVELYAKGLPPAVLDQIAAAAAPLKPMIKTKAMDEVPVLIRDKTAKYKGYPAPLMAIGLGRASTVRWSGDEAVLTVKLSDRTVELTMARNGTNWKIVGIRDETLARQVAEKVGRELVLAAIKGGVREIADKLGIGGVNEILNQLDDIVR